MPRANPVRSSGLAWLREPCNGTMRYVQHWGFTEQAERWNGRLAMLGFVLALATELLTGQGVIQQLSGLLPHR